MTQSGQAICAIVLGVLAAAGVVTEASAHAKLMSSSPVKDGEGASPAEIVLTFNEPVTPAVVTLSDQEGHEIRAVGTPRPDAAVLHVPVNGKLAPGRYTLTYRIAGADTHVVNGALTFVVAKSAP